MGKIIKRSFKALVSQRDWLTLKKSKCIQSKKWIKRNIPRSWAVKSDTIVLLSWLGSGGGWQRIRSTPGWESILWSNKLLRCLSWNCQTTSQQVFRDSSGFKGFDWELSQFNSFNFLSIKLPFQCRFFGFGQVNNSLQDSILLVVKGTTLAILFTLYSPPLNSKCNCLYLVPEWLLIDNVLPLRWLWVFVWPLSSPWLRLLHPCPGSCTRRSTSKQCHIPIPYLLVKHPPDAVCVQIFSCWLPPSYLPGQVPVAVTTRGGLWNRSTLLLPFLASVCTVCVVELRGFKGIVMFIRS